MDVEPRLQPLPATTWDDSLQRVLTNLPGGLDHPLNIFSTLARHPVLFRRWMGFGGALLDGELSARLRELVILRVADACRSEYERVQHVRLARFAGISEEEMEALRHPLSDYTWGEVEMVGLAAADELLHSGTWTDETWHAVHGLLGDTGAIELIMLVGQYQMVAMTLRTLRVQLEASP
jgi:alkylhydroperoxidase family enzyme